MYPVLNLIQTLAPSGAFLLPAVCDCKTAQGAKHEIQTR
ncbi:hypothetical protein J651_0339 [Acinetobacter baumannii 1293320]|nr:hypothetical protein J651_0339 [Acinetobacter baumannii 1293320]